MMYWRYALSATGREERTRTNEFGWKAEEQDSSGIAKCPFQKIILFENYAAPHFGFPKSGA